MFRIRRIYDVTAPASRKRVAQVQDVLRAQFPTLAEREVAKLPDRLRDPFARGFRSVLLVAENARGSVRGFALLLHAPRMIGALGVPILVVQEGGYRTRTLGSNARNFFEGLWDGRAGP